MTLSDSLCVVYFRKVIDDGKLGNYRPPHSTFVAGHCMNALTDGEAYERLMGRWSREVGIQFLDWLDLPKGLRCLDVGCGDGAFTEVSAARVANRTRTTSRYRDEMTP
jgi:2-polyprenyl-3-methyl-5-hydroxy-6-metoxy-1,4-benzoquinol methylase